MSKNDDIASPEAALGDFDLRKYLTKPMMPLHLPNYFMSTQEQGAQDVETVFAEQVIIETGSRNLS